MYTKKKTHTCIYARLLYHKIKEYCKLSNEGNKTLSIQSEILQIHSLEREKERVEGKETGSAKTATVISV